jgi:hypothetical protein
VARAGAEAGVVDGPLISLLLTSLSLSLSLMLPFLMLLFSDGALDALSDTMISESKNPGLLLPSLVSVPAPATAPAFALAPCLVFPLAEEGAFTSHSKLSSTELQSK